MNDLISVIIPTYNRAHLLSNAIQSVLQQTYPHWELIIVDDGSTDTTKEVVENFIARDSRIRYFYKENGGQGSARNVAIRNARGAWILPLDSDDIILPSGSFELLSSAKKNSADIVWGKTWRVIWGTKKVLGIGGAAPSSVLLNKKIFDVYGLYDENRELLEDVDHLYRLEPYIKTGSIHLLKIKTPTSIYFVHGGQDTSLSHPKYLLMKANAMIARWGSMEHMHDPYYIDHMIRWWRNKGSYEILLGERRLGVLSLKKSFSFGFSISTFFLIFLSMFGVSFFQKVTIFIKKFIEISSFKILYYAFISKVPHKRLIFEFNSVLDKIL